MVYSPVDVGCGKGIPAICVDVNFLADPKFQGFDEGTCPPLIEGEGGEVEVQPT